MKVTSLLLTEIKPGILVRLHPTYRCIDFVSFQTRVLSLFEFFFFFFFFFFENLEPIKGSMIIIVL